MISDIFRDKTINFCKTLVASNGLASEATGGNVSISSTLSVCKTLEYLGVPPLFPDNILESVLKLYDKETRAFCDDLGNPNVFACSASMLLLKAIGAFKELKACSKTVLSFMDNASKIREEHFMTIAVKDECGLHDIEVPKSVGFFRNMEKDAQFGSSILNNGIASSALLRLGKKISNPDKVKKLLLSSQKKDGGFGEPNSKSDLWTSYCVMRALDLLEGKPDTQKLSEWILKMSAEAGFSSNGDKASAGTTYQALSILHSLSDSVIQRVKTNDLSFLKEWVENGGNPNISTLTGWTPLMIASVRGYSEMVDFLLTDDRLGDKVDSEIKLTSADALPIFWAGQSGNLDTVKVILKKKPEQLFEISKVNGHNLILQAAFFGSAKHYQVVEWILENISSILGISPNDDKAVQAAINRLTSSCNVRGYTGYTMSKLWGNKEIGQLFTKYDTSTRVEKDKSLESLLKIIAEPIPEKEPQRTQRVLADQIAKVIEDSFKTLNEIDSSDEEKAIETRKQLLETIKEEISNPEFDINTLGGPLQQTPVIISVTGVDEKQHVAEFRKDLLLMLLDKGADPDIPEKHPMAVDAIIRTAVLNHFDLLKIISTYMKPLEFAAALNEIPAINGQTALQDTVHRALTSEGESLEKHLLQIEWCVKHGAKIDIEDHTGTSPEMLANKALTDNIYKTNAKAVLKALGK